MVSLSTPLKDLLDYDSLLQAMGFVVSQAGISLMREPHLHDKEWIDILTLRMEQIRSGKTTIGDYLGMKEHESPVIDRSYLKGISVEKMAAGLMEMGVGYPFFPADYALLPIIYSVNALGFNKDEHIGDKINFQSEHYLKSNGRLLTQDSCIGHVRVVNRAMYYSDHDDKQVVRSEDYVLLPELHSGMLSLAYRPGESEKKQLIEELVEEMKNYTNLDIKSSPAHGLNYYVITGKSWGQLNANNDYPIVVTDSDYLKKAQHIQDAAGEAWLSIIRSINTVAARHGRNDLLVDESLIDRIKDYSLNSRYNSIFTHGLFASGHADIDNHHTAGHSDSYHHH
ncbi:MAG: hypothetical protein NDI94_05395 [Candidatus Woesearchaeota archaeon]|nr:hypothetical protein [Candidatus Woesearchaeota archaeon]